MFNRSKVWALALLAAVFAAGAAAGWTLQAWADYREGWRPGAERGARGQEAMVDRLTRELALSPAQQDSVRAILTRHRGEMEALWRQVHPRLDSLRQVIRGEIAAQLAPPQRAEFLRLIAEMEHHHRGADGTRDTIGGGRD